MPLMQSRPGMTAREFLARKGVVGGWMTLEQECLQRVLIAELIQRERAARDGGLWQVMAECWHPESRIDTSWFRGSGAEFVAASERNAKTSKTLSFHDLGPSVVTVQGNRAIADTGCAVYGMLTLKQVDVAVLTHTRFLSRALKVEDKWLLAGVAVLYVRDMLIPRNPTQVPEIDSTLLSSFRDSYRYLSYVLAQSGHPVRSDLAGIDLPETVAALRTRESRWLEDGVE